MNKARREQIAKAVWLIQEAQSIIDDVHSEEMEAYENMPEGLKNGDRGEAAQNAVNALSEANDACDDACENLESAAK